MIVQRRMMPVDKNVNVRMPEGTTSIVADRMTGMLSSGKTIQLQRFGENLPIILPTKKYCSMPVVERCQFIASPTCCSPLIGRVVMVGSSFSYGDSVKYHSAGNTRQSAYNEKTTAQQRRNLSTMTTASGGSSFGYDSYSENMPIKEFWAKDFSLIPPLIDASNSRASYYSERSSETREPCSLKRSVAFESLKVEKNVRFSDNMQVFNYPTRALSKRERVLKELISERRQKFSNLVDEIKVLSAEYNINMNCSEKEQFIKFELKGKDEDDYYRSLERDQKTLNDYARQLYSTKGDIQSGAKLIGKKLKIDGFSDEVRFGLSHDGLKIKGDKAARFYFKALSEEIMLKEDKTLSALGCVNLSDY